MNDEAEKRTAGVHVMPGGTLLKMENVEIEGFHDAVRNEGSIGEIADSRFRAAASPAPQKKKGAIRAAGKFLRDVSVGAIAAVIGSSIKP